MHKKAEDSDKRSRFKPARPREAIIVTPLLLVLLILTTAPCAWAVPTLGDILQNPALDDITDTGRIYMSLEHSWMLIEMNIILENAGFRATNKFGIFDIDRPECRLEVFDGPAQEGQTTDVIFDTDEHKAWIDPMNKAEIGARFGFYLDSSERSSGGFFYSDSSLNTAADYNITHFLFFDTKNITGLIPGDPHSVIAFEDLRISTCVYDGDYNDMVVGIKSQIPEPVTIALLGLGSLFVILPRRRR